MIPLKDNIPTDRFPIVTVLIIVINVMVFLFFQGASLSGEQVKEKPLLEYGMIPYRVTHPGKECTIARPPTTDIPGAEALVCEGTPDYRQAVQSGATLEKLDEGPSWLTIFTSMFMHGGWLHIIFNMLFLWIFGNNVEDSMGKLRFTFFYVIGGVVAALAQVAVNADSTAPTVGASGAIAAVLGGYLLLYPRARVLTIVFIFFFFTFIELPAMLLLGIWFVLQFLPAVGQLASPDVANQGGIAYFAHVGGFLCGLALIHLFAKRRSKHYGEPPYPVY